MRTRGTKNYELKNHLGNVIATSYSPKFNEGEVSDRLLSSGSNGTITSFSAQVLSYSDYYPFGQMMDGRYATSYRYGFNGMEKDPEFANSSSHYDFGARIYDSRIGRWLSCDALENEYPFVSTYNFVLNMPIIAIDPDGNRVFIVVYERKVDPRTHKASLTRHVLDVTTDMDQIEKFDPKFAALYKQMKETQIGASTYGSIETSEKEDIYLASTMLPQNSDTWGDFIMGKDVPMIVGSTDPSPNIDDNGTFQCVIFDPKELDPDSDLEVVENEEFSDFNDIKPRAGITNYLVVIDKTVIDVNADNPVQQQQLLIETLLHEFIAHITYYKEGEKSAKKHHDKYYGKENGNKLDYTEDSDYSKVKKQVKEVTEQKESE